MKPVVPDGILGQSQSHRKIGLVCVGVGSLVCAFMVVASHFWIDHRTQVLEDQHVDLQTSFLRRLDDMEKEFAKSPFGRGGEEVAEVSVVDLLHPPASRCHRYQNNAQENPLGNDGWWDRREGCDNLTLDLGSSVQDHSRRLVEEVLFDCDAHYEGELRLQRYDYQYCLDVPGESGTSGDSFPWHCDGFMDQRFVLCYVGNTVDGYPVYTIRVRASGNVLQEYYGDVRVRAYAPGSTWSAFQEWVLPDPVWLSDVMVNGVQQPLLTRFQNRGNGQCMDWYRAWWLHDGMGDMRMKNCQTSETDQWFIVHSRGKIVNQGTLQNVKSQRCLDVSGHHGYGNILTWDCEDREDQVWTLYESGELVNAKSKRCLNVHGTDGRGWVYIWHCDAKRDQQFDVHFITSENKDFMLANRQSSTPHARQCLDVSGRDGHGDVSIWSCEYVSDQWWFWNPPSWISGDIPPQTSWDIVGCHNEEFSRTVEICVTETRSETRELAIALTIGQTWKHGLGDTAGQSSWSLEVSSAFSSSFERSQGTCTSVEKSCQSGCLWQLTGLVQDVVWETSYTMCAVAMPSCQPVRSNLHNFCYGPDA